MLKPDLARWNQTLNDLFALAIRAEHPRSRERFLALYRLASEGGGATAYAVQTNRDRITVMEWVRKYNEFGAQALHYRRSGGTVPLFRKRALARSLN
jgi:hypothetical protein